MKLEGMKWELSIHCRTYTFGTDLKDQQVGCLWSGNHLLTVSLSGQITYLDREGQKPIRTIRVRFHLSSFSYLETYSRDIIRVLLLWRSLVMKAKEQEFLVVVMMVWLSVGVRMGEKWIILMEMLTPIKFKD